MPEELAERYGEAFDGKVVDEGWLVRDPDGYAVILVGL